MARPPRIEYPGALYHVISHTNKQRPIVTADAAEGLFLGREGFADRIKGLVADRGVDGAMPVLDRLERELKKRGESRANH